MTFVVLITPPDTLTTIWSTLFFFASSSSALSSYTHTYIHTMVKPESDVIKEFNELVNMTPQELKDWLQTEDSQGAGWHNPDSAVGEGKGGEAVGHESGRKIIQILESNPDKKPDGYGEKDVEHMRRVVSYCKRHKAGESAGNSSKSEEELKQTKSYKSLKNWGHDLLKAQGKKKSTSSPSPSKSQKESPSKGHSKQDASPSKSNSPIKGSGSSKAEEKPKTPKKTPQKHQTRKTPGSGTKSNEKDKATSEKSPLKQTSEKPQSTRQTRSSGKTKGDEKREADDGPTDEPSPKKTKKD